MKDELLPLLARVHGHVGALAIAALAHPALLGRRRRLPAVATALVTTTAAFGAALYPAYGRAVRPALASRAPGLAWAFERKEHLGVLAVALAWAGLGLLEADAARGSARGTAGRLAYGLAAVAAASAAAIGTVVSAGGAPP